MDSDRGIILPGARAGTIWKSSESPRSFIVLRGLDPIRMQDWHEKMGEKDKGFALTDEGKVELMTHGLFAANGCATYWLDDEPFELVDP